MHPAGTGRSVAVDPMVGEMVHPSVLAAVVSVAGAGVPVHLVGPAHLLEAALADPASSEGITLHDAPTQIGVDEDVAVVRGRATASVRVALDLLAEGVVDALWSAARLELLLAAAVFRLARPQASPDATGSTDVAQQLIAAARPAVAVTLRAPTGGTPLTVVDAGVADRSTASDVVGRILAVARPGERVGVLATTSASRAVAGEARLLASRAGLDLRVVDATEAVCGAVDVVGCTSETGAVMVQTLRATGRRTTGLARVTGVAGDVFALLPADLDASSIPFAFQPGPTSRDLPQVAS